MTRGATIAFAFVATMTRLLDTRRVFVVILALGLFTMAAPPLPTRMSGGTFARDN